ncbi:MAG: hypothetical protein WBA74_08055, partial [Cyclobacteriaceae bacterium]
MKNIISVIESFVKDHTPENWAKCQFAIVVQPKARQMDCRYFKENGEEVFLDTFDHPYTEEVWKAAEQLHREYSDIDNQWNKATLCFFPAKPSTVEMWWDQAYQDEIDEANRKEMRKDPG